MDISMLVGDGLEASKQLAIDSPCPIILLSGPVMPNWSGERSISHFRPICSSRSSRKI